MSHCGAPDLNTIITCVCTCVLAVVEVLPDSGANISAAGIDFLAQLNESILNISPSDVKPCAMNGNTLSPLGSLKNRQNISEITQAWRKIFYVGQGMALGMCMRKEKCDVL